MLDDPEQQFITQFGKAAWQTNRKKNHLNEQAPWSGRAVLLAPAGAVQRDRPLQLQQPGADRAALCAKVFRCISVKSIIAVLRPAVLPQASQIAGETLFGVFLRRMSRRFRRRMTISPEQFIIALCRGLLHRQPDREALAICVQHLEAGMPLTDAVEFIVSTNEYRTRIRAAALEADDALGRPAHPDRTPAQKLLSDIVMRPREPANPNVLFLQTADPYHYYDMLAETSRTVRAYCQKHEFWYESYIGIKRGFFSWHAAYNRIMILRELMISGFSGWVFYLDADAFITRLDFDLREYLRDKSGYAGIFVDPGEKDEWYHMNNGIFLINMANAAAHELIRKWHEEFMKISDHELSLATDWGYLRHDQDLLHVVFYDNQEFRSSIFLESPYLLGWSPGFVRQFTRGEAETLAERKRIIKGCVEEIMGSAASASDIDEVGERNARVIVSALYKTLLGKMPEGGIRDDCFSMLRENGLQYGLPQVVEALIETEQFKSRFAPGTETEINLEQARLVGGALYRSLFNRAPDWHALNAIPAQLREQGLEKGLQNVIADMMQCNEFLIGHEARQRAAATPQS